MDCFLNRFLSLNGYRFCFLLLFGIQIYSISFRFSDIEKNKKFDMLSISVTYFMYFLILNCCSWVKHRWNITLGQLQNCQRFTVNPDEIKRRCLSEYLYDSEISMFHVRRIFLKLTIRMDYLWRSETLCRIIN